MDPGQHRPKTMHNLTADHRSLHTRTKLRTVTPRRATTSARLLRYHYQHYHYHYVIMFIWRSSDVKQTWVRASKDRNPCAILTADRRRSKQNLEARRVERLYSLTNTIARLFLFMIQIVFWRHEASKLNEQTNMDQGQRMPVYLHRNTKPS